MPFDAAAMTKWSAKMLNDLRDAHVFKEMTNQDYEGEVRFAANLKIFMVPEVTTTTYARGDTITYNRPTPGELNLVIDQRNIFALKIDKLEQQLASAGGLALWEKTIRRGAFQLADDVDDFIRDAMDSGTPSANTLTSRTIGLGLNASAYELLVDLSTTMDEDNIPREGRHVAISPAYKGFLTKDPRWTSYNTAEAVKNIRGAPIGKVEDLEVHVSNNLAVSGTTFTIQAAWDGAFTYGEQLEELRHIPVTAGDKDERVDSELVFGGKVIVPQGLANCDVQFAT